MQQDDKVCLLSQTAWVLVDRRLGSSRRNEATRLARQYAKRSTLAMAGYGK